MKKSARKILSLVLSFVLVCTLATAAFAVTADPVEHDYDGCIISGSLSLERRKVTANLSVEAEDDTTYFGSISVTYTYYQYNHEDMDDYRTASVSNTFERPRDGASATKSFATGSIFSMRDATAHFNLDAVTTEATIDFHSTRSVSFPYPSE